MSRLTRRLVALLSFTVIVGGAVATAMPSASASETDGYICIGMTDPGMPGHYVERFCVGS